MTRSGLWDELDTAWLLLDAELLPWSLKAAGLLRQQYAAVGAAARAVFPGVLSALERAAARGVDVPDLLTAQRERAADAAAFTAAYRRYCWPVEGLAGVRLAPFQILAADGRSLAAVAHDEQLRLIDQLVAADTESGSSLLATTRRCYVDTSDDRSTAAGAAWWTELTAAGGEGMVVKPLQALVRGAGTGPESTAGRLVQPGIKCRGQRNTCASSTAPTTPAPTTWRGCATGTWATSAR